MISEHSLTEKVRYYSNVGTIYVLTLLFAWLIISPVSHPDQSILLASALQKPLVLTSYNVPVVAGQPVRIVIPASHIDLPVDPGYYDSSQASWTLSGYHAQYAMISTPANNIAGDTFIYGHNNNYVFGALRHVTPSLGAQALVYTNNGHILVYSYKAVYNLSPDDTAVLTYNGPPILTIQTCTGSLNEWRTMYRFNFTQVQQ